MQRSQLAELTGQQLVVHLGHRLIDADAITDPHVHVLDATLHAAAQLDRLAEQLAWIAAAHDHRSTLDGIRDDGRRSRTGVFTGVLAHLGRTRDQVAARQTRGERQPSGVIAKHHRDRGGN